MNEILRDSLLLDLIELLDDTRRALDAAILLDSDDMLNLAGDAVAALGEATGFLVELRYREHARAFENGEKS